MSGYLVSVNVGETKAADWAETGVTAFDKQAVATAVEITTTGIAGDGGVPVTHDISPVHTLYVVAREDLDEWGERLGATLRHGIFGEHLTLSGIEVNDARIGTQWRIGSDVVVEVTDVPSPCLDFENWMDVSGFDALQWTKRFTAAARPGAYVRVLTPGRVRVGDTVDAIGAPTETETVTELFTRLYVEPPMPAPLFGQGRRFQGPVAADPSQPRPEMPSL